MPGFDTNPNVLSVQGYKPAVGSPMGVSYVSQSGLPYARWVAKGWGWQVIEASTTATVTALPTTTAAVTLHNLEQSSGRWYVIHSIFAQMEASPATLSGFGLAHCVGRNAVADAANDLARSTSITPLLAGAGQYKGRANVDLGATVVDDLWKPIGQFAASNLASAAGCCNDVFMDGLVIVQPGCQYSIESVSNSTSVTVRLGIRWFEVDPAELM